MRHTAITYGILTNHLWLQKVAQLAGHKSLQTTTKYLHFSTTDLRATADELDSQVRGHLSRKKRQFIISLAKKINTTLRLLTK